MRILLGESFLRLVAPCATAPIICKANDLGSPLHIAMQVGLYLADVFNAYVVYLNCGPDHATQRNPDLMRL